MADARWNKRLVIRRSTRVCGSTTFCRVCGVRQDLGAVISRIQMISMERDAAAGVHILLV